MRHHSFMRWTSATMAALMFFQCTAPVAFAADDTILAESSIVASSAESESVSVDSDAGYIPEQSPENTSVDSSSNDAASSEPLTGDSSASSDLPEDASSNGSVESQPESDTDQISTSDETTDSELAESSSENTDESAKSLYQDGKILIYTYDQLAEIGSGQTLTDASGLAVTDENGAEITYALDAQYAIAEDIELTDDMLQWQLPEGFTGSITPLAESGDDLTLYDAQSDTIYLYNPYQMTVLHGENPDTEPVMDGDAQAETFGSGQLIYPNGEEGAYLTYSSTHHYVLSKQFSSEVSVQPYSVTVTGGKADGRDFAGQVVKTIGDKTYILIGNEQQLRAIGTDAVVNGAVYQAYRPVIGWDVDTDKDEKPIMLYGGDADLTAEQNGKQNFTFGKILDTDKSLSNKGNTHIRGRCGVNQKTGEIDPNLDIEKTTNQKYAANANYIIFRDIDLSSANWTPLTFRGTMIGTKLGANAATDARLWENGQIIATDKPVISNVKVVQSGPLDVGKQMGVGFFSTLYDEASEDDVGISKGQVLVSNLRFENISVDNQSTTTKYDQTLVNGLVTGLSQALGGLVDLLTWLLTFGSVDAGLRKTLTDVLDARKKDPTALATGAFAGRIIGNTVVSNCELAGNVSVTSPNNYTAGFVGYIEGKTQYDGLSKALGGVAKLLANILNVIPGLGLGDLITILLGGAIDVSKLIPTAYINAKIVNCRVEGLNSTIGTESKDFAGGFAGMQAGAIIENCTVTNSSLNVVGKNFVGGFVGLSRDSTIKGVLKDLGVVVNNLPNMKPESLLLNCRLDNTSIKVNGASYAGGFAGGLANSSTVNCSATAGESLAVHATGMNAGGFAGIATLGWAANLGKTDSKDSDLLGSVVSLVEGLLSQNPGEVSSLLSLAGVNPSYILGCTINAPLTVTGTDFVGGITGRGDGVTIAPSNAENLGKISYWKRGVYKVEETAAQPVSVTGLKIISGHDYTGGIAGSLGTASVSGLLNDTAGIASYLGFTVDSVTLTGYESGFTVEGWERVGGGFGDAIGGTINNVSINKLRSVEGKNYAGGFIGLSGPGELVGTSGGLTVNLLGLNYLLTLNKLLSIGQYVQVTIKDANVNGIDKDGFTVEATEKREANSVLDYTAAGFIARSNSTKIENAHVTNLKSVTAANDGGYAAGFVAISKTGGLAEVGEDSTQVKSLIEANELVTAISYLIPSYTNCTVSYVDGGSVTGDVAGGFTADFQSGTVNNQARGETDYYAVYNLGSVNGQSYAGGFAGRVYSGALADASKGISILGDLTGVNIKLSDLLSVINAYVPYIQYAGVYAGVKSDGGFTVTATKLTEDTTVGSAGGFVGYASGAQISYSDVTKLKHTIVTPPDNLEDTSAPTYFNNESAYAVTGGRYAGGYVGDMDIGSAASVGGGLKVLGNAVSVTGILNALSVVVTTIEHSDVTGGTGGYAVLATGDKGNGKVGMAGGYAGGMYGGHIQDSQAVNFSYIIGEIAAGGYVGEMQPGDVAKLLKNASILDGLVNVNEVLASVLQSFVPSIRNSSTNCVPCGGAVRANAASVETVQRGMAGGFVGHNMGGTIHGFDTSLWLAEDDTSKAYNGPMSLCKAERIRSVYGREYAGGYTGLMEPADTAKVGGLEVLKGLISVNNILGALGVIYPVQTNTAVYGPLAGLDVQTWNDWVEYVGKYGGYGYELAQTGKVDSQAELDAKLADYIYGYNVVAGRSEFDNMLYGGDAGGYVGCMNSGTLTNCMAYDAKQVSAMHSAGGFAGQMKTGGAVELGTVNILGLNLNLGQLVNIAQLFVPAIRNSSVQGYQSGLTVQATGLPENHCGYSGGYVGSAYGAQIQLDGANKLPTADQWKSTSKYAAPVASCNATNLRRVTGRIAVGGYVGLASAGSVAGVNTNASNGLLQGILDHLISAPGNLVKVLQATATTIHAATVSAADSKWGFVVDGAYKDGDAVKYAAYAGGFAGSLEASIVGESKETAGNQIKVQDLRSVDGGKYAGGFFGLADVAGVAQVSGKDPKGSEAKLLSGLIKLGNTSVLDAFRTYIYDSKVTGVQSGLTVQAHSGSQEATQSETRYTGCAGGFGGGMMDGSVKNSAVSNLANVEGLNYTGGFVGHLGKSGVADIDDVSVLEELLGGTVGVLDLFGSHVENCTVTGFGLGTVVEAKGGEQPIAGGFAGYADLAKINGCSTTALKQVTSGEIAGGFIGKTDMNYVVSAELQSKLLNTVFEIVNKLLSILYVGKLQNLGVLNVDLGWVLTVKLLADGKTLAVSLLGLQIGVALNQKAGPGQSDLAIITIGDSVIELPCTEKGGIDKDKISNVKINLIKGNRTDIDGCSVTGISSGYDVFAGGAGNAADGTDKEGFSGGFIGLNHEGQVKNSTMTLCDVVRGTENLVGPFTGVNDLKSVYSFNTIKSIEGNNNHYSIYRAYNALLAKVAKANKDVFGSAEKDTSTGTDYNRYEVLHLDKITEFSDLKDAKMEDAAAATTADLAAYESPAKAVLMLDTANTDNPDSTITEPADTADPCKKYVDLTISKIWKDFANIDGKRPNEIKVNIYQQEFKPDGTAGNKTLYKAIIMTKDDVESGHASTWRTVLKNAPVLKYQKAADGTVTDTIEAYYVYLFEEEAVPGYTLTGSTYDEKTYHATITNTHHPMLPDTGSTGDWLYVVVGVGILLLALSVPRKRKGRREAH